MTKKSVVDVIICVNCRRGGFLPSMGLREDFWNGYCDQFNDFSRGFGLYHNLDLGNKNGRTSAHWKGLVSVTVNDLSVPYLLGVPHTTLSLQNLVSLWAFEQRGESQMTIFPYRGQIKKCFKKNNEAMDLLVFCFEKQLELKLLSFVLKINANMAKREFPSSFE